MKIVDPQTATLTNIEVLSYLTANAPRKPPQAPPGARHFNPKPDLRDHCTVVTEIHNYVERISPHLLDYPRYTHDIQQDPKTHTFQQPSTDQQQPYIQPSEPTPLDNAIRKLLQELKPYGLTKGEVMMMINLGVGLKNKNAGADSMEVDRGEVAVDEDGNQEEGGEEDDDAYSNNVLIESVIEELGARLKEGDKEDIFRIMNKTLGSAE
ncbi:hypothetical protein BGW36DRAFT_382669 [Talaromyces proteolyticus]|uniref:DNA-directed RNA polymerase III subunit RPC9 n=1 Tax=Talaromyces proteolyticus TaxID=1131652 RepID=A0AAD4PWS5_9EURO|nr:uncharacterized protein BGW36DRAFT_382669 [Talaromyces proteolyticus]KAH8695425.1 hypothetical protein BGW36DRAFT_382669 [Talaromyces proteolyticus]